MIWKIEVNNRDHAVNRRTYPFWKLEKAGDVLEMFGRRLEPMTARDGIYAYAARRNYRVRTMIDRIRNAVIIERIS